MKVIQDAILYNKIECYNKEYKEVSLVQWKVALTPQDIYAAPDAGCLEERQRKVPLFLYWIMSQLISAEPIEC